MPFPLLPRLVGFRKDEIGYPALKIANLGPNSREAQIVAILNLKKNSHLFGVFPPVVTHPDPGEELQVLPGGQLVE